MIKKIYILILMILMLSMASCELENISSYVRHEKIQKIKECEYERDVESGLLFHYLHSKDRGVQIEAIKALGRIGDPKAVPYLIEKLNEDDEEILINVLFALGLIGDRGVEKDVLPLIYQQREVCIAAIEALGLLNSELLLDKANDLIERNDPAIIENLAYAIANIGKKDAAGLLREYADKLTGSPKLAVIYALYKLSDEQSYEIFMQAMNDSDEWVRFYAAKGLGMIRKREAIPMLYEHLHDESRMVVVAVLEAISNIDEIDIKIIGPFIKAKHFDIRYQTALLLGKYSNKESISLLKKLLKDKSEMVVNAALYSLSKIDKEEAMKYIKKNYRNKSYLKRVGVAKALGNILTDEGLELLKQMFQDKDIRVREEVLESLKNFSKNELREFYLKCMDDTDYVIRALCAQNLEKYAVKEDIGKYYEVYRKAEMEGDQEGQQIILKAMVGIDEENSKQLLLSGINSEYMAIRLLSAELLKNKFNMDVLEEVYKRSVGRGIKRYCLYEADYKESPLIYIVTTKGNIVLRLFGDEAPLHVQNMVNLAKEGFYNKLIFHRVVPGFVVQGGDPRGDGWGTGGIILPDEINRLKYKAGSVGMPLAGKDTGGCQFFITLTPQPRLNYKYTLFGEVEQGMSVLADIETGDKIKKVIVVD